MYAVQGFLLLAASTWNVGSALRLGWRLAVFDQDNLDLSAFTTPFYSMWQDNLPNGVSVAVNANEGFLKEDYLDVSNIAGTVVTTSSSWKIPIKWNSPRGSPSGTVRRSSCTWKAPPAASLRGSSRGSDA